VWEAACLLASLPALWHAPEKTSWY